MWWRVGMVQEIEASLKAAEALIALADERLNQYNLLSEDKQELILTPQKQETPLITSATPSTAIYIHKFIQHYAEHENVAYEDARTKIVSHIEECLRRRRTDDPSHPFDKPVKILCLCGRVFRVRLEGRKWDRKRTRLPGLFIDSACVPEGTNVTVEDLSRGGIRFRTHASPTFTVDDVLTVQFVMESGLRVDLRRPVRVKHIQNQVVGVQFCPLSADETDIDIYFIP